MAPNPFYINFTRLKGKTYARLAHNARASGKVRTIVFVHFGRVSSKEAKALADWVGAFPLKRPWVDRSEDGNEINLVALGKLNLAEKNALRRWVKDTLPRRYSIKPRVAAK
jgi:hypothetical protein